MAYEYISLKYIIFSLSIGIDKPEQTLVPDQIPQNVESDQGLHCLPITQQFLDTSTGSKLLQGKYCNELNCSNDK